MEAAKCVGFFVQYVVLPAIVLFSAAYFILFANSKIEKRPVLKIFGNCIAILTLLTAFLVVSCGVYSMGLYNKKMSCLLPGMGKKEIPQDK